MELSPTDFNNIKNLASDLNKGKAASVRPNAEQFIVLDVKLLERWYLLDDKLSPPVYRLRDPDEDFANILSRSTSTYDVSQRENQEWNDAYTSLIDLFVTVLHDKSTSKSKHETSSLHDIQLFSGVEMLFNYATKLSPSGCMCILRQFDGNAHLRLWFCLQSSRRLLSLLLLWTVEYLFQILFALPEMNPSKDERSETCHPFLLILCREKNLLQATKRIIIVLGLVFHQTIADLSSRKVLLSTRCFLFFFFRMA